jgi:putative sterol carrier protein
MSRYIKLLSLAPKIFKLAMKSDELREIAKRYGGKRSCQIELFDEAGEALSMWVGIEGEDVSVKQGKYPSTNTLRMHIDVFLDILARKLDFRTAVAHGLVEIESHDGLPWSFHYFLWASFWDKALELIS